MPGTVVNDFTRSMFVRHELNVRRNPTWHRPRAAPARGSLVQMCRCACSQFREPRPRGHDGHRRSAYCPPFPRKRESGTLDPGSAGSVVPSGVMIATVRSLIALLLVLQTGTVSPAVPAGESAGSVRGDVHARSGRRDCCSNSLVASPGANDLYISTSHTEPAGMFALFSRRPASSAANGPSQETGFNLSHTTTNAPQEGPQHRHHLRLGRERRPARLEERDVAVTGSARPPGQVQLPVGADAGI